MSLDFTSFVAFHVMFHFQVWVPKLEGNFLELRLSSLRICRDKSIDGMFGMESSLGTNFGEMHLFTTV